MKQLFTTIFLFFSIVSFGQATKKVDSLSFCRNRYAVPQGCVAESEYQVECDNYSIVWLYMKEEMLTAMPDQFIDQMAVQMKKFKKTPITCYLLGKEVKGYKISFKGDKGTRHQLIAYGTANGQPVMVQLSLNEEPKTNDDIPQFPRQIIRLTN